MKHNINCKRVFNRYDPDCARCKELENGATPRPGWGRPKRNIRKEIENHNCEKSDCGPVCTAFDW